MTAIAHLARAYVLADRDALHVAVITGAALIAGSMLLFHYGSFARALASIGLSSSG